MKISIASDLHLEFGGLVIENTEQADVLILSGDICVISDLFIEEGKVVISKFFENVSKQFKNVIYVMGNHEHYHHDFAESYKVLTEFLRPYTNIYLLENETLEIDGIMFIGSTLWTDMNNEDHLTIFHLGSRMNDYRVIGNSNAPSGMLTTEHILNHHKNSLAYIRNVLEHNNQKKPVVVCTHHSPSRLSTHPRYVNDFIMNGGYSSGLEEFIMDRPEIKLWTHGHTHVPFDYDIESTRIVCNPRGYVGHELLANEFRLKTVEVFA